MFLFLLVSLCLYCPLTHSSKPLQSEQGEFTIARTVEQNEAHIRITTIIRHHKTNQEVAATTDYLPGTDALTGLETDLLQNRGTCIFCNNSKNRYQNFIVSIFPKATKLLKELPHEANNLDDHANQVVHFDRTQFPIEAKKDLDSACCIL